MKIKQSDFVNGSYRIKYAGEYILLEDIIFNPISSRKDMPKWVGSLLSALKQIMLL